MATSEKQQSEHWLEEYAGQLGLDGADDHHPDLGGVKRPDYRLSRGSAATSRAVVLPGALACNRGAA